MAIFRSGSKNQGGVPQADTKGERLETHNIHDPILSAVNEAQPFEEANQYGRRPSYLSTESSELRDIFGQQIRQTDMLNPARSRNERPLDTIRGFEFAITGDHSYRDQLESSRLGWGFHEDFPHNNLSSVVQDGSQGYSAPVASFSGDQAVYQAKNYSASSLNPQKKKKKGLFGRKK